MSWIQRLASLRLTVVLLVAFVLVLAAGTMVEARYGSSVAQAVYQAPWFFGLQFLLTLNLLCSLISRWPWGRSRVGFALTHGAVVVILGGSLTTAINKIEGQLALWEGEENDEFVDARTPGSISRHRLPFTVHLEAFEIDYYPGTTRPAQFRSRVRVDDPSREISRPAIIEMNRPLKYRGFHLFQTSYRQEEGRDMTILSVSRDPGQPIVFCGYFLLIIGMTTVLATRLSQRRQKVLDNLDPNRIQTRQSAAGLRIIGLLILGLVTTGSSFAMAETAFLPDDSSVERLRSVPVQHDGRVMPLDTLAREAIWRVTGQRRWDGIDPVALLVGWRVEPEAWSEIPLMPISSRLRDALGLTGSGPEVSMRQLASSSQLVLMIEQARESEGSTTPLLSEVRELQDRLIWLRQGLTGELLQLVPGHSDGTTWSVPAHLTTVRQLLALGRELALDPPPGYPVQREMTSEVLYNRLRLTRIAWLLFSITTLLALFSHLRSRPWLSHATRLSLALGWLIMTLEIAWRWRIAGRIPATNMYESMLFLGWGVGLFALLASLADRQRLVVLNASAVAATSMLLVDVLPLDPFIHPLPPVLTGTPWLAIHVPIIMVSYSVFAIGVLVAHAQLVVALVVPQRRDLVRRLTESLYWYMHVGSILLTAGILTGSIWAASSWGRYWGWDPKEVWSLIALLAYMGILHARLETIIGPWGVAALSISAFWTILMTYLGVNFVLTAGLHSYGFGESPVATWLSLTAAAELLFLLGATAVQLRRPVMP